MGKGLAVRIPKAFAKEAGLQANDEVEITIRDGHIITAWTTPSYSLDDLLSGVTPDNRPDEWAVGPATGDEVW